MSLQPGTHIGPYEVLAKLGEGGMGEVYRAHDTKLRRDVAIKVLPESFASDPDRLARFHREAHVLASLNHPHIAQIYGLEESPATAGRYEAVDDVSGFSRTSDPSRTIRALVMEFVDGGTLAERIAHGPLPIDEALSIAKQIAGALEAAHGHGVIHRDLKPSNIALSSEQQVRVLDFGLAKLAVSGVAAAGSASLSPTITSPAMLTGAGVLLGTAAYMAPEQAKGREADKRCDLWAFGCVVFEMLAGKRAFGGEDATEVIAAIVRGEPDWSALPAALPPSVRTLLRQCLEKDRTRRMADIAVAQFLLNEADTPPPVVAPARASWTVIASVSAAALVIGAALGIGAMRLTARPAAPRVSRLEIVPDIAAALASPTGSNIAISRDGTIIVYCATWHNVPQLLVRRIGDLESRPLPGTEQALIPFISPDNSRVGFVAGAQLKTVALAGGPPTVIAADAGDVRGASWVGDTIVFAQERTGLFRMPAGGGQMESIVKPDAAKGELSLRWPDVLPDGSAVLYSVYGMGGPAQARIVARRFDTGATKVLIEGGNSPHYADSGHLVYGSMPSTVMAVPFDSSKLEVRGAPVSVLAFANLKSGGAMNFAVAGDGTALYVRGQSTVFQNALDLQWQQRDGQAAGVVATQLEGVRYPRLSPDGRSVALTIGPANRGNLWLFDLTGASQSRELTFKAHNIQPVWSPDGKYLAFASDRAGVQGLFRIASDGSELEPVPLAKGAGPQIPSSWSPDGRFIMYSESRGAAHTDLMLLDTSDRTSRPWLDSQFIEEEGSFSPDGRWVAYVSDQTGGPEIWVRPFPSPGAPIRVSPDGGHEPVWSRSGSELYYQKGQKMMMAAVETRDPLRLKAPVVLFEGGFVAFEENVPRTYDVAPDGRFLTIKGGQRAIPPTLVVIQNWFEELKRVAPAR